MIWIYGFFFVLALAKWLDAPFLLEASWGWILVPLFLVILWFEVLERAFGFDKERDLREGDMEKAKRERVRQQLQGKKARRR